MSNIGAVPRFFYEEDCTKYLVDKINELNSLTLIINVLAIVRDDKYLELEPFVKLASSQTSYSFNSIVYKASHPTLEQLFELYTKVKDLKADVIVAMGGGSIMDLVKSLCALKTLDIQDVDKLREIIVSKEYKSVKKIPWIAIPTTCGSGSEVTCFATIWDKKEGVKLSLETPDNHAFIALSDGENIKSLPRKTLLIGAFDALCHAVESYWSVASNDRSREIAKGSIVLIVASMVQIIDEGEIPYQNMITGSTFAGLAIAQTKTTAAHSISYALTLKYNIPHGLAAALVLPYVLKLNYRNIPEKKELLKLFTSQNAEGFIETWNGLLDEFELERHLSAYGAKKEDLEELLLKCINKDRANKNPVPLTPKNVRAILEAVL